MDREALSSICFRLYGTTYSFIAQIHTARRIALIVVQALLLYVDSSVLMVTAEIPFREVWGQTSFSRASIIELAALGIVVVVSRRERPEYFGSLACRRHAVRLRYDQPCSSANQRPWTAVG